MTSPNRHTSPNIRELLPNTTDRGHAAIAREIAGAGAGRVVAVNVWTHEVIGEMPVGDGQGPAATVYAEEAGLSRSSGGILYEPWFMKLPHSEITA